MTTRRLLLLSSLWIGLASCSLGDGSLGGTVVGDDGADLAPPAAPLDAGAVRDAAPADPLARFAVHEWGTYTSIAASSGVSLEGMQHEEEALPAFVHARLFGDPMQNKGVEEHLAGVTQKLETPVLYFYTPVARAVKVTVDFPQGILSQWFPAAAAYQPPIGGIAGVAGGRMSWDANLVPGLAGFPPVDANDIWAPSRRVASVPVQVGGEHEQFIFYRGVGAFTVPFRVTAQPDGSLSLSNLSLDRIADVFVLRVQDGRGGIAAVGAIEPNSSRSAVQPPAQGAVDQFERYVQTASDTIAASLVKSGLHTDEARAMVDTWSRSYFRSQGLRVLYLAPRGWTDRLLPLQIEPRPAELVRTLVGRVEVLTPADERELVAHVTTAAQAGTAPKTLITGLGRLAEPKLRRTLELLGDPITRAYCRDAVALAQTTR